MKPGYVDLQSPAGLGISVIVFNYDADVYASDEARMLKEMGDDEFKLENLHQNTYEEIFGADVLLEALSIISRILADVLDCGYQTYAGAIRYTTMPRKAT